MISLPPPPILKVIHRSHHSRCGEEILGSHTGAPTATQGAPTGYKARDIHTVEELRINRGTTARQIYIRGTTATQICMKYINRGTTGRKIYRGQPHSNIYQIYQQGHHSHTNIYQPATQPHWPSCQASGTTQSKGTPQEKPKK